MSEVRSVVRSVLSQRTVAKIKVRQPLSSLQIKNQKINKELLELIKEEVNIKKITFGKTLKLDTKITQKLREEGTVRELIRRIQDTRKKQGLKPKDEIHVEYSGPEKQILEKNKTTIIKEANIKKLTLVDKKEPSLTIKKI